MVRRLLALVEDTACESATAAQDQAFWREHGERTRRVLDRAEQLGQALRSRPFDLVLCHADINAANILVGEVGRIWLIDWDGRLVAPRERDLLFVVGSRIARAVSPRDEAAELAVTSFAPCGDIDRAEMAGSRHRPGTSV